MHTYKLGYDSNFKPESYARFTQIMNKLPDLNTLTQKIKEFKDNTAKVILLLSIFNRKMHY